MTNRPTATYSIVAIDKAHGQMGIAVQSHWFSVGSITGWIEPDVGVIATQSFHDLAHGQLGLALLKAGKTPDEALTALKSIDPTPGVRQTAILDVNGRVGVHTGDQCIPESGHVLGEGFSTQANTMRNTGIWPAMAASFRRSEGSLAQRLMDALDAGEAAGGDVRGRQSASILIMRTRSTGLRWKDKIVDLRVDDHKEPLKELRRLLRIHEAYQHAINADTLMTEGKIQEAMQEYSYADEKAPEIEESRFWQAVALASKGRMEEAAPLLKTVFAVNPDWKQVLRSLPRTRLFDLDEKATSTLLQL